MCRLVRGKRMVVCVALAWTAVCAVALGQTATFTGVGVLPGDATSNAYSVSRDGVAVTGESVDSAGNPEAFIFITNTGAKTALGFPVGWTTTTGRGVDRNTGGQVFVTGWGKNESGVERAFFYDGAVSPPAFTLIEPMSGGPANWGRAVQCHFSGDVRVTGQSERGSLPKHAFLWRKLEPNALNLADPPTDPDGNGNVSDPTCLGIRPSGETVIRGNTSESGWPCGGGNNPMGWSWYSGDSTTYELWWAMTTLSCPVSVPFNSRAFGTSADGRYIVGASTIDGATCGTNRLAYLHDTNDKDVDASCNPPGGHWWPLQYCIAPSGGGASPCIWGSKMLGSLPGHENYSEALAVSLDGQVVVGRARKLNLPCTWGEPEASRAAFIWDPTNGMRDLKTVLSSAPYNLDLTGWVLNEATSISNDGGVICGLGLHNGVVEGWVATIGRPGSVGSCCHSDLTCTETDLPGCDGAFYPGQVCASTLCCHLPFADSDGDGDVDQDDFGAFQICYSGTGAVPTGCDCFDRNQDNRVDVNDLQAFTSCWTGPNVPWAANLTPACIP